MKRFITLFLAAPLALAAPAPCPSYAPNTPLQSCQYTLYRTALWFEDYITGLLQNEGVTSSELLPNPWPSYLWNLYERSTWNCELGSPCASPTAPPQSASPDSINAYIVLQSINTFATYMSGLNSVMTTSLSYLENPSSQDSFNGVVTSFTPDDPAARAPDALPSGNRAANWTLLYKLAMAVLGSFPRPPATAQGLSGYQWITSFLSLPYTFPSAYSAPDAVFSTMCNDMLNSVGDGWDAFARNSTFAYNIFNNGAFIGVPSNVTNAWSNPTVNNFSRFISDFSNGTLPTMWSTAINNGQ
jgi:hypothetical protein